MTNSISFLSAAIWIPILTGLFLLSFGNDRNPAVARAVALIGSLAGLLVTVPLYTRFDTASAKMQFVEHMPWIERFGVSYHLGVDGISLWFVLLTAFITVIVVIAGWRVIEERVAGYMASFLILSGLMIGVFSALDGLLFYVFFEATLIPMYIIIGIWGGPNRVYAAFKFFLYTLLGSLLTLVAQDGARAASSEPPSGITTALCEIAQAKRLPALAAWAVARLPWPLRRRRLLASRPE
jgi:NADH-quinone oxidoreductase subunit M